MLEIQTRSGKKYFYHPYFNRLIERHDDLIENLPASNCRSDINYFVMGNNPLTSFLPHPFDGFSYKISYGKFHKMLSLKIVFCMTYNCNFRCKYCVYGPKYTKYGYNAYSSETISYDIIIQTVYYVINMYRKNEYELVFGFYGGEPLLQFDLIKKSIEEINCICQGYRISYSLSTNGSLIADCMIDFFLKHKVNIFISVDGDSETHDLNRVDSNGMPTHEIVFSKIKNICKNYPTYFSDNVYFNVTYDHETDIQKIMDFFIENKDYFPSNKIQLSDVIDFEGFNSDKHGSYFARIASLALSKLLNQFNVSSISSYKEGFEFSLGSRLLFEQIGILHNNLNFNKIQNRKVYPSGCCYPGRDVLYVDPIGSYYFCKSLAFKHNCIGNVNIGINKDAVNRVIDRYEQLMLDSCRNCWAMNLCKQCFFSIGMNMDYNLSIDNICDKYRRSLYNNLVTYCEIISSDKHFFARHRNKFPS